ncbi:hypothetical protein DFH11DRAFT_1602418 [Phellopilus nigrolimitatus]|nr:hypothetical protein DFH11DRAFT_1602418 [Phellopilus nigrolimitatus]
MHHKAGAKYITVSYMPPNMSDMPGAEQYMQYPPQPWQMHQQQQQQPKPHPQTPQAHPYGLPVSPRQPPLQSPGTPPTGIAVQLPSADPRLNTNASAFVPGQVPPAQALQQRKSKVKITDASGNEVDLNGLRRQTSSVPSTPAAEKNRRATVRLETEEARLKRIAEKTKRDQEEVAEGEGGGGAEEARGEGGGGEEEEG